MGLGAEEMHHFLKMHLERGRSVYEYCSNEGSIFLFQLRFSGVYSTPTYYQDGWFYGDG